MIAANEEGDDGGGGGGDSLGSAAPLEQRLLLLELVESAESKLSRRRRAAASTATATTTTKLPHVARGPSGDFGREGGHLGTANDNAYAYNDDGGPEVRVGGATPTNDLVRQLRARDRAAFGRGGVAGREDPRDEDDEEAEIRAGQLLRVPLLEPRPGPRSASPRRATVASTTNEGRRPGSARASPPEATPRRHSAYLFPAYLLRAAASRAGASSEASSRSSSSSSDSPEGAGRPAEAGQQGSRPALSRASELRQLRNSTSSPSALNATPTNDNELPTAAGVTGSGTCACCRSRAGPAAAALPRPPPPTTLSSHRKRHSLMEALQAGQRLLWPPAPGKLAAASEQVSLANTGECSAEYQEWPVIPESGFKIAVMGCSGSGKTSLIRRFLYDAFNWRHQPTVEDTYFVEFPYLKQMINISISDTSGTYQFPAMRRLAISSSDAFILVYSVDSPASLDYLEQLRRDILEERERAYLEQPCAAAAAAGEPCQAAAAAPAAAERQQARGPAQHNQRHWSLASIFSHHQPPAAGTGSRHPSLQQRPHNASLSSSLASNSSQTTGGSNSASSNCSSSDSSRRSSVSAAEAALKTRRQRRPPMVIVANKYDLAKEEHLVNSDEIEALAVIDWNNGFVRASAALNLNIDQIFQQVLRQAKQPPLLSEAIASKRRKSLPPKLPNLHHHH